MRLRETEDELECLLGLAHLRFRELTGEAWQAIPGVDEADRGLELLDLTIADPRHRRRLRELTRLRETLADYFVFDNVYSSTDESWRRYFHAFTYAAALRRDR